MVTKVNLKARINRHSKIIKNTLSDVHPIVALYRNFNYYIVILVVIFVMPIYPSFALFFSPASEFDFDRWVIDESTILDSFDASESVETWITSGGYFNVRTLLDDSRDREWVNEIIEYTVVSGDSFSWLADKFEVTKDSIYWANNLEKTAELKVGQKLQIPSISWLIHEVKKSDTLESIAKKYSISEWKIVSQNRLEWTELEVWMKIIIPWAKKAITKPNYGYSFATAVWKSGQSKYVVDDGKYPYKLVKRNNKHTFVWWNCTYFVAEYKNVTWRWNAKDWLRNAQAKWVSTWSTPAYWSIVVLHGKWYNPYYGHVWIVMDVKEDSIIVKDMNYRRLNEVTTREIPKADRAIRWYIYVN